MAMDERCRTCWPSETVVLKRHDRDTTRIILEFISRYALL